MLITSQFFKRGILWVHKSVAIFEKEKLLNHLTDQPLIAWNFPWLEGVAIRKPLGDITQTLKLVTFSTFLLLRRAVHVKQNATKLGWYMLALCDTMCFFLCNTTIFCCCFISKLKLTKSWKMTNSSYEEETDFLRVHLEKYITIFFFRPEFLFPICCATCPCGMFPHASRAREVSFFSFLFYPTAC